MNRENKREFFHKRWTIKKFYDILNKIENRKIDTSLGMPQG
jgi:hypothetical protein